jgi:magnesium chelatase subunit D
MNTVFPFSAIVGQERLKLALRLVAVDPKIGGVLIRGPKGIAKSTAARSLARLLEAVEGRPVPFVDLPLGASEDRVIGTLDVTHALRDGERRFQPGLLFQAHGGMLYVDEVNLLTDYLIDILLDAAATGLLIVERDGISERRTTRFQLLGTMNPDEGELRPQLLDRFALCCDLEDLSTPEQRALAVRRRLDFDEDPAAFERAFAEPEHLEVERLSAARVQLSGLKLPGAFVDAVAHYALAQGAQGLRADLILCRAARAHAALSGRTEVSWEDVQPVEELCLAHRRRQPPDGGTPPPIPGRKPEDLTGSGSRRDGGERRWEPRIESAPPPEALGDPLGSLEAARGSARDRRFRPVASAEGGLKRMVSYRPELGVDLSASLLGHAITGAPVLHSVLRFGRPPVLTILCVDASGSMGGHRRIAYAKGLLAEAMRRAYQRRHRFALVAFRGAQPCEVVAPTRGLRGMLARLDTITVGGATSIAAGLEAACSFIACERRRQPALRADLVLVTDGRANQSLRGGPPLEEALSIARGLGGLQWLRATVLDAESGQIRLGLAASLARALGAILAPLVMTKGGGNSL